MNKNVDPENYKKLTKLLKSMKSRGADTSKL